ncbi:MAG: hypothetical protein Q7R22_008275 [Verrucomicrobiota bacterium JB025]|nr:hypothetical protein [Verrucomicrobiota bacterium JB025]
MQTIVRASLGRIAKFGDFDIQPVDRDKWRMADYAVAEVTDPPGPSSWVEVRSGRMIQVIQKDRILGAFGNRYATLDMTGRWSDIGDDLRFHLLTGAGIFGQVTSISPYATSPIKLKYVGHVFKDGHSCNMADYAIQGTDRQFEHPVLMIIGSSMSAGKTNSARILIRRLKKLGLRVLAAKLTGAGRYRDVLTMRDAGADVIYDFTDAGLPSTVCSTEEYNDAAKRLLSRMAAEDVDVAVIEAGASPLEPYNGDTAIKLLEPHIKLSILCASDPYAAYGFMLIGQIRPDLISGVTCNTDAGQELVKKLTGIMPIRLNDPDAIAPVDQLLANLFAA